MDNTIKTSGDYTGRQLGTYMKMAKRHEIANANKMDTAGRAEEAALVGGVGRVEPVEEEVLPEELELELDPVVVEVEVVPVLVAAVVPVEVVEVPVVVLVVVVVLLLLLLLTKPPPFEVEDEELVETAVLVALEDEVEVPVLLLLLLPATVSTTADTVVEPTVTPVEAID